MQFRLPNPSFNPSFKIHHRDRLFFIGSCFSENINTYFKDRKFISLSNPHGVLYNPVSIAKSVKDIISKTPLEKAALYESNAGIQSFHHHSCIVNSSSEALGHTITEINQAAYECIENVDVVLITLGTAWVHWHKKIQQVVANNLRAPASYFEKKLLTVDEIKTAMQGMLNDLRNIKSDIKVVLTVSPVRHAKQGLEANNRSKARLIEAVHQLIEEDIRLVYLPTYEIMIDVLRDYRFYKKDLVHPNELAIDYIWEYLEENFILENDIPLINKLVKLTTAAKHKLFNPQSEDSKLFVAAQIEVIQEIEKSYSYIDLRNEKNYFENL